MTPRWLVLALPSVSLLASGCFDTHGSGDAGRPLYDVGVTWDAPLPDASGPDASGPDAALPVPDAARTCRPASVTSVRATRVLYDDQPLVLTVRAAADGGCGCDPVLAPITPSSASITASLCECCDACDCIDPGYEISQAGASWPVGEHTIATPTGEALPLLVTTRDRTFPLTPTGLRAELPSDAVRTAGPEVRWVAVGATVSVCCVEPVVAVDEGVGPAGEIVLSLESAWQEDCACVGEPMPIEVWWPLVSLPSGEHVVRAGDFETTVRIF
jgi:hypothetical protein